MLVAATKITYQKVDWAQSLFPNAPIQQGSVQ